MNSVKSYNFKNRFWAFSMILSLVCFSFNIFSYSAFSAPNKSLVSKKHKTVLNAKKRSSKTETSKPSKPIESKINFNDRVVNGKHQMPGEGLVTVENEKPVFNIISIRTDFKDRRESERQRD